MINGKYMKKVKNLIIDVAPYNCGFEVAVMKARSADYVESCWVSTETEAEHMFNEYIAKYDVLKGKYAQLSADIGCAVTEALVAVSDVNDGGTCNFDHTAIRLPRWKEADVLRAIKEAGVRGYKHGSYFHIGTPRVGMAYRNTVAAEKMTEILKVKGYDVRTWYVID